MSRYVGTPSYLAGGGEGRTSSSLEDSPQVRRLILHEGQVNRMERHLVLGLCLSLLVVTSGCIGLLTEDEDTPRTTGVQTTTTTEQTTVEGTVFALSFEVNDSAADGIGFDYNVTNIGTEGGTARLVVVAKAQNGSTYERVRTFSLEPGESKVVTVVFEEFDSYTGPTVTADVMVVDEE